MTTADLDGYGLRALTWESCDDLAGGELLASPADANGRGIALSVEVDGAAADMTGAAVFLLWRHRATRARGCEPFEAVSAAGGTWRVFYPAAMAACEGAVDAQILASLADGSAISTRVFPIEVEQVVVGDAGGSGCAGGDGFALFVEAINAYREAEAAADAAGDLAAAAAAAARQAAADVLAAMERGDFDGADGVDGVNGTDGADGADGADGVDGQDGADGVSPSASVAQTDEGCVLTVTDATGTTTATILHGEKGDPGDTPDLTAYATKAYVDGAIAALDDLSEVEF